MTEIRDGRLTGAQYPTTHADALALRDAVWMVGSDPTCGWVRELPCDDDTRAVLERLQSEYLWPYAFTGHKFAARSHLALCELVRSLRPAPPPPPPAPIEQPRQLSLWGDL